MFATLIILSIVSSTEPPVDFRCDTLRVDSGAGKSLCIGNVVVVRGPVLMCCDHLEAFAKEDWKWKSFTCKGNVKAKRHNENAWSNLATFEFDSSIITLQGEPVLKRGRSLMTGTEVIINLENDQAQVRAPRGRIARESQSPTDLSHTPKLVESCPISPKPVF